MRTIKSLQNRIRGWFPKDLYASSSQGQASSKARAVYVVGYGVGIGVYELGILAIYLFGWGNIERGLSPAVGLLSNLIIVLPLVVAAMIIGAWLSKKLQKRWRINLL